MIKIIPLDNKKRSIEKKEKAIKETIKKKEVNKILKILFKITIQLFHLMVFSIDSFLLKADIQIFLFDSHLVYVQLNQKTSLSK